jgi:hypothetical protein
VKHLLSNDRLGRLFAGFVVINLVVIAVFGWQAVESQEVKGSLKGGLASPVELPGPSGQAVDVSASYVNTGTRALTLEATELIEPHEVEVVDWSASSPGGGGATSIEGYEVPPGKTVQIRAVVEATGPTAGFTDLRLQYRAGGRAGQTP